MFDPINARFASSCSKKGINEAEIEAIWFGATSVKCTADSAREVGKVEWTTSGSGHHELRAEVRDAAGKPLSENVFEFDISG